MELIDTTSLTTDSNLSTWVGPAALQMPLPVTFPRGEEKSSTFDTFDYSDRVLMPDPIPVGPAAPNTYGFIDPLQVLKERHIPFMQQSNNFVGFSYDSIDVRISLSDPKCISGGIHLNWIPYYDYFDENILGTIDKWYQAGLNQQAMLNSPYTQLALFGTSTDTLFTIPWCYKYSYMPMDQFRTVTTNGAQSTRPFTGHPILTWNCMESHYVSSVVNSAQLRYFITFKGIKFYGPTLLTELQSGVEAVMPIIGTLAMEKLGETLSEITSLSLEPTSDFAYDDAPIPGNYDNPQSVQMSYLGDTTSRGPPTTRPIFRSNFDPPSITADTDVHKMLARPQYLLTFSTATGTPPTLQNNPMNFLKENALGMATYFRFLGQMNTYWRGTMNIHVIVAGHPMVECLLIGTTDYISANSAHSTKPEMVSQHRTIFSGSKHVVFPMPYLSPLDYLPIFDSFVNPDNYAIKFHTSTLTLSLSVQSTMLDIAPVIPAYVFVSAGPDFKFYQPYPVGLYNIENAAPLTELQIGLPMNSEMEVATTRAALTADPGIYVAFKDLRDYMKIWSRCVPFVDYDNDGDQEPIPDPQPGFVSASWYPPVDRSAEVDVNNSWFFTNDYVSMLSSLYVFYRGTIGFKLVIHPRAPDEPAFFAYVALKPDLNYRQRAHMPFPYTDFQNLPANSNFAIGSVVTPIALQPVLELSVPYRGYTTWNYVQYQAYDRGIGASVEGIPAYVSHNIILQDPDGDKLYDAMFRKIDTDYALALESIMPPPLMWVAKGYNWTDLKTTPTPTAKLPPAIPARKAKSTTTTTLVVLN